MEKRNLEKELQKVQAELEETSKRALLLQADFENAKKRWLKSQAEFQEQANADLLREFLEVRDDFERAVKAGALNADPEALRAGVEMIVQRIEALLKRYGVVPIEAVGAAFDPARHDAVAHEITDAVPESTVLEELKKGYLMNGRVLRHAVVKVAVHPDLATQKTEDGKAESREGKSCNPTSDL